MNLRTTPILTTLYLSGHTYFPLETIDFSPVKTFLGKDVTLQPSAN